MRQYTEEEARSKLLVSTDVTIASWEKDSENALSIQVKLDVVCGMGCAALIFHNTPYLLMSSPKIRIYSYSPLET
jgi:hypothetical protein